MLDKFLEEYVVKLYNNSNVNMSIEQRNLYSKEKYYILLKPVVELLNKYPDDTIQELRDKLFSLSGIEAKLKDFIYMKKMTPGVVISYGTNDYKETIVVGNREEVKLIDGKLVPSVSKMQEDTIFDLASITKLYTSISILKLVEKGLISLEDEITKYLPNFKNLKEVTIFDLLSFKVPLKTSKRIDLAKDYKEAFSVLEDIEIGYLDTYDNPYTDMGAIVLKYVIEAVTKMPYYDFLDKEILKPCGLTDTHVLVPSYKLNRVASTRFGGNISKDGEFLRDLSGKVGMPHDPKARALNQEGHDLPGHAGLFSTASDMSNLAKSLINKEVLTNSYLEEMALNRTGKRIILGQEIKYIQYFGYLCYSKHPHLADSELFHAMSGKSFASGGFTGGQFTLDPMNEIYFYLGTNRVHNRVVRDFSKNYQDIEDKDGTLVTNASRFSWERDEYLVHPCLELAIQFKMLEDFYKLCKEKITYQEKKRVI